MTREPVIPPEEIVETVTDLLLRAMHAKQARSVALAVVGVFKVLVPWIIADRKEIVISFDWTTYGADGHSRIAINLVTNHGRATPLLWKTVLTGSLRRKRNRFEDEALLLLAEVLPPEVKVILLADRGFGDVKLYEFLRDKLHWDFVIRFREAIHVELPNGVHAPASEWVPTNGQIMELSDAMVTTVRFPIRLRKPERRDRFLLVAGGATRFFAAIRQAFERLLTNHVYERATFAVI